MHTKNKILEIVRICIKKNAKNFKNMLKIHTKNKFKKMIIKINFKNVLFLLSFGVDPFIPLIGKKIYFIKMNNYILVLFGLVLICSILAILAVNPIQSIYT